MKLHYAVGFFFLGFLCPSWAFASDLVTPVYVSGKARESEADSYKKMQKISSRYLSYRDLERWLDRVPGRSALDYGSGLGFSAEFLLTKGFQVKGTDINLNMLQRAKEHLPTVDLVPMANNRIPFADQSFDLVFSSLVLFELGSKEELQTYAREAHRVLRENGIFIAVTGSVHMYDPNYKSELRKSDFPQNRHPKSGSRVKVTLNEADVTFEDFYWLEADYREAFQKADLPICAVHYPLGLPEEGYPWKDELQKSPFLLILAAKKCSGLEGIRVSNAF